MSRLSVSCILLFSTCIVQVTAQTNYCSGAPCKNGATCTSLTSGYHCQCKAGFTGMNCDQPVNECRSNPCMNGGTCGDITNGYECICRSGSYGLRCEHLGTNTACSSNYQCPPDRMCVQQTVGYRCDCLPGTQGDPCTDINECLSNPCGQYGTCWNGNNGYLCHCQDGSVGPTCSVGPCGVCARGQCNADTGYKCVCQPAVTGPSCHEVIPSDATGVRGGINLQMPAVEFYSPAGQQLKVELEQKLKEKLLYVPHAGLTVTGFGLANGGKPGLEAYFYIKSQQQLNRQDLSVFANDIARALYGMNGASIYLNGAYRLIQDPMVVFVTDVDQTNILVHLTGNDVCAIYTHARWCLNGGSCVADTTRPTCRCPDTIKGRFCDDGTNRKIIIIVCSVVGSLILLAILLCCCCFFCRRRRPEGPRYVDDNYVVKRPISIIAPPPVPALPCTCHNTKTTCTCIKPVVVVSPPSVGGHVPSQPTPSYTAFVNQTTPIITEIKTVPEPTCSCNSTCSCGHAH